MALNSLALLAHTFDNVAKAEDFAFAAWSGAVTTALSVTTFGNGACTEKQARASMAKRAAEAGINTNTWQSYVGSMFKAADKLSKLAETLADFQSLPDLDTADACTLVEMWLRSLGMETGGHIRDWTKQDGLEPFNPNAARDKRNAKAVSASDADDAAFAGNVAHSKLAPVGGAISDMAGPVDALAGLKASIAAISNMADATAILTAINAKLAELQDLAAKAPAPTTAPVLADTALVDAKSALAKHFAKQAA